MKIVDSNQIWEGFFTYQDGYEDIDQYIDVDFTMNLIFNGDSFHGTSEDSESKYFFDKPTQVKGFVDGNKISFVLNYPYAYFKDYDGQIFVDKNSKHPEIHYFGIFDETEKDEEENSHHSKSKSNPTMILSRFFEYLSK